MKHVLMCCAVKSQIVRKKHLRKAAGKRICKMMKAIFMKQAVNRVRIETQLRK
jgi:hypothetical protein